MFFILSFGFGLNLDMGDQNNGKESCDALEYAKNDLDDRSDLTK